MTNVPNKQKNTTASVKEDNAEVERMRAKARLQRERAVRELANRVVVTAEGRKLIQRFNVSQQIQHQILIGSFTTLGITGALQSFSRFDFVALIINLLGGIDTLRVIHHLAAIIFGLQSIYHVVELVNAMFVKRKVGGMLPAIQDAKNLFGMMWFNLGRAKERPQFDRYSVEEKFEYWALVWGTLIMGLTGIFQWYPALVTQILPGIFIPAARRIHAWEALLAITAILLWHTYHVVIKEKNTSIFTGYMSEEEMIETHPLEYQRIMEAYELIHNPKPEGKKPTSHNTKTDLNNEVAETATTD
jgi:cytochrome b subunit of formate dehydrogenase